MLGIAMLTMVRSSSDMKLPSMSTFTAAPVSSKPTTSTERCS